MFSLFQNTQLKQQKDAIDLVNCKEIVCQIQTILHESSAGQSFVIGAFSFFAVAKDYLFGSSDAPAMEKAKQELSKHRDKFSKDVNSFCNQIIEDLTSAKISSEKAEKILISTKELVIAFFLPHDLPAFHKQIEQFGNIAKGSMIDYLLGRHDETQRLAATVKDDAIQFEKFLLQGDAPSESTNRPAFN